MRIRKFTHLNGWKHGAVYYNNCLCNWFNNKKHGVEIHYNDRIYYTIKWFNNTKCGIEIEYYDNGQIMIKCNWLNDKQHGEEIHYLKTGMIFCIYHWLNDKRIF